MWSHFDDAKTSRAAAFITDCKRRTRCSGMPANTALQQSNRGSTRHDTSDWMTVLGTERWMSRSRRYTAKQADVVFMTWDLIETSASMWIPRSRTTRTGVIRSEPTRRCCCGNRCERRPVVSHADVFRFGSVELEPVWSHPAGSNIDTLRNTAL